MLRGKPFTKSYTPWNKGKNYSGMGWGLKKGCVSSFKGKQHSPESKKKISENKKNKPSWNKGIKGIPWTEDRKKAQLLYIPKPRKNVLNGREYHPFWHEIRKLVYKRDGNRCRECGRFGKMNAHHIDYDITNNDLSNLITLCMSCHSKTNFKRVDWINHYTENRTL